MNKNNRFTVMEEKVIPPRSTVVEQSFDPNIPDGQIILELLPHTGYEFEASIPYDDAMPLLTATIEIQASVEEVENKYRHLINKKVSIPLVGKYLAKPIEDEGNRKLDELDNNSKDINRKLRRLLFAHMPKEKKEGFIDSIDDYWNESGMEPGEYIYYEGRSVRTGLDSDTKNPYAFILYPFLIAILLIAFIRELMGGSVDWVVLFWLIGLPFIVSSIIIFTECDTVGEAITEYIVPLTMIGAALWGLWQIIR